MMWHTDCQESLRRSFELGVQVGIYRHTREMLSWSKKRRRRIAREELIAHLCGKAVPASRMRASQSQFAKTPVKSTSTSALGRFASVDSVEPDLQLFHDALAVHGVLICLVRIVSSCYIGSYSIAVARKVGRYQISGFSSGWLDILPFLLSGWSSQMLNGTRYHSLIFHILKLHNSIRAWMS